jgi:anti-anti-sigma factor
VCVARVGFFPPTLDPGNMPSETSIFTVVQSEGRTAVAFRDWPSVCEAIYSFDFTTFLDRMRTELEDAIAENQCAVLVINMAPADFVPSSFLAVLVGLNQRGVDIKLLHPSAAVRQALEVTNLHHLFAVRD